MLKEKNYPLFREFLSTTHFSLMTIFILKINDTTVENFIRKSMVVIHLQERLVVESH